MAVLEILKYPDPRLKQSSTPVETFDDCLREFIAELERTMRAGPGGVGIAAPQVAEFIRVAVVDVSGKPDIEHHGRLVLVNPEIVAYDGFTKGREGCMSVPDYTGNVVRAEHISVEYFDEYGQPHALQSSGFEARAIQHELDHLEGLLFLDRLVSRRSDLFRRKVYT
ncbi:peptide deformylase [Candidatus Tenderia electrophaga]|uniref:Peptide deformylase n=1 Tax=Candidatus Tenderia electrophaga TaxID=1748243 RepID=A0A0S2TCQ4_9GAMM|nr:peptide deformylase [Candidatus Tenderia electrophaga]